MDTSRPNARLNGGLKPMGDGDSVGPWSAIAKPGDDLQGVRKLVCIIQPEQEKARRSDFDLPKQDANARLQ